MSTQPTLALDFGHLGGDLGVDHNAPLVIAMALGSLELYGFGAQERRSTLQMWVKCALRTAFGQLLGTLPDHRPLYGNPKG